ncbi:MAG: hypothetical protein KDJ52_04540 [Anaerolineae bacterium]|nr:hypothetical protein [Anaerolineae bacterium]
MAKSKRASIKDKSPESLGMTQKKNKGIDLLFGGAVNKEDFDTDNQAEVEEDTVALNTPNSDDTIDMNNQANDRLVDELGLPVALEAPPDDLILASAPVTSTSQTEEVNFDLSNSPFAYPEITAISDNATDDANDLSGLIEESSITLEGVTLSGSEEKDNVSGSADAGNVAEKDISMLTAQNVTGIAPPSPPQADNISNNIDTEVADMPTVDDINDLSGLVVEETGTIPHTPPPPVSTPPSVSTDFSTSVTYTPPPVSNTSVGTAAHSPYSGLPIDQAPAGVINALSTFAEAVPVTRESFRPQDEFAEVGDHVLSVSEFHAAERDAALSEKIINYVGAERRDKLFNEVEALYTAIAKELSGNKKDANFALDTLRQAHNLILEDPREYDEAFYRVAIVKTMLDRKTNLQRWSYTWGLFVLFYGIAWLVLCMVGYFLPIDMAQLQESTVSSVALQAWFSGLAGGIGGAVAILWTLYYRVSVKQDFDRQYLMWYMVKPILGFVLGLVMYFLLIAASSMFGNAGTTPGFDTSTGIALSIFFGFVAGFRQDNVYDWIYVIIKAISPKATPESQSKTPLIPYDLQEEVKES